MHWYLFYKILDYKHVDYIYWLIYICYFERVQEMFCCEYQGASNAWMYVIIVSLIQFVNINVLHEFFWLMFHYMISIKYLIMLFQILLLSCNVCMNVLGFEELFRHTNVWICKLPFFFIQNIHNKLSCDRICQHCCQINVLCLSLITCIWK